MSYVYNYIFKSLKKSLKEEYFKQEEKEENIDGNKKNVHEISLRVDNALIINILNSVIDDLKSDKKAYSILTDIDPSFKKYRIKDNAKYLDKDETYTIHVYTTKVLYRPLKYRVIQN